MKEKAALLAALCLLLWTPALPAQSSLEEAGRAFAARWFAGDVAGLAGLLHPGGVRLQLGQGGQAPVGVRQAAAALREVHQGVRGSGRVVRISPVGGSPPRGSMELDWRVSGAGPDEVLARSVFVVFTQEGGEWRASEIRVLR